MKISVIVPCYNEERYIIKVLQKINSQKEKYNLEIIISDDCSTDKTINILKENKNLKNEIENLRNDLTQTREFVESLHNIILENNQKLMGFSMEGMEMAEFGDDDYSNLNNEILESSPNDEIAGINLKEEIENQLNGNLEE